jgi:precorrin-2 dehydrogenase / sirohydrochlorin ferrochelatase
MMELYPVMIRLAGQRVSVIGAGEVALRKVRDLLRCGARVCVIAPVMHADFDALADEYSAVLELKRREYCSGDIDGSLLVIAATDDTEVNRAVFTEAQQRSILINAVDDPPNCSFFVPSSFRKGDFLLSISTGGASPAMAARLCREFQGYVPEHIDSLLKALAAVRAVLKDTSCFAHLDAGSRAQILKSIVHDDARLEQLRIAFEQADIVAFLQGSG